MTDCTSSLLTTRAWRSTAQGVERGELKPPAVTFANVASKLVGRFTQPASARSPATINQYMPQPAPSHRREVVMVDDDMAFNADAVVGFRRQGSRVLPFAGPDPFLAWTDERAAESSGGVAPVTRILIIDLIMVPLVRDPRLNAKNTCSYWTTGIQVLEVLRKESKLSLFKTIVLYSRESSDQRQNQLRVWTRDFSSAVGNVDVSYLSKSDVPPADLPKYLGA